MNQKQALRKGMLKKRQSLSQEDRARLSLGVVTALVQSGVLEQARTVLAYLPYKGEVDLSALFDWLEQGGRCILFPKVTNQALGLMEPVMVRAPWRNNVRPGAFGILEPAAGSEQIEPSLLSVVLVPGVAFDGAFYRLGFGGGFYDRFLPRLSAHTLKVGVAYDFQLVAEVPRDPHDIPLDGLCTEAGLILRDGNTTSGGFLV